MMLRTAVTASPAPAGFHARAGGSGPHRATGGDREERKTGQSAVPEASEVAGKVLGTQPHGPRTYCPRHDTTGTASIMCHCVTS